MCRSAAPRPRDPAPPPPATRCAGTRPPPKPGGGEKHRVVRPSPLPQVLGEGLGVGARVRKRAGGALLPCALAVVLCLLCMSPVMAKGGVAIPQVNIAMAGSKRPE